MSQASVSAWVVSSTYGQSRDVYHTDKSCPRLDEAAKYRPASGHEVRDFRECRECSGKANYGREDGNDGMTCPICGEEFGNLPNHLRTCP